MSGRNLGEKMEEGSSSHLHPKRKIGSQRKSFSQQSDILGLLNAIFLAGRCDSFF
jgi:hypothetical protein